jgi:hypothetical protein
VNILSSKKKVKCKYINMLINLGVFNEHKLFLKANFITW